MEMTLPAGSYTILRFAIERRHEGATWKLIGRPAESGFEVREGESTPLSAGDALRFDLTVERSGKAFVFTPALNHQGRRDTPGTARVTKTLPGPGTETRRTRWIRPRILIIDPYGKIVFEDVLSRVHGGVFAPYRWTAPALSPGTYSATVEMDTGPFPIEIPKVEFRVD
jgi:hypothetical protein